MTSASPAPSDVLSAFDRAKGRVTSLQLVAHWYESVSSTMDIVQDAAQAGAGEGLVVVANEQTSGRGRRGRAWSSPPGVGLYLSFLFRPSRSGGAAAMSLLTLAAGVAVRAAIAIASGLCAELKWPNDVMVGRRKLAGILAEGIGVGTRDESVVLGVGINILATAHSAEVARRATSVQAELGRPVDRTRILEEVIVAICERYGELRQGNPGDILREWRAGAPAAMGALVEWHAHDGTRRGTTIGIDDEGALLVRTSSGVERLVGGEVHWP
jgi:BirA family biotin operon repressor/biotin-[acetyl-CoA-carboxylase] ligase